jgi:hypothetical protein
MQGALILDSGSQQWALESLGCGLSAVSLSQHHDHTWRPLVRSFRLSGPICGPGTDRQFCPGGRSVCAYTDGCLPECLMLQAPFLFFKTVLVNECCPYCDGLNKISIGQDISLPKEPGVVVNVRRLDIHSWSRTQVAWLPLRAGFRAGLGVQSPHGLGDMSGRSPSILSLREAGARRL